MLIDARLQDRMLTDTQLARLIKGTPQRRHHLINRATKAGELVRLRRGRYVLAAAFRNLPAHPFVLAQAFLPGSYVSFETALAYHGWIPEAVHVTACVTPGSKSSEVEHPVFGSFSFSPLPLQKGHFLEMVARVELNAQVALVARPLRALMDLVCLRKQEWQGLGWLVDGLRVDDEHLRSTTSADIRILQSTYKLARMQAFLKALARELGND
jgi:hypothetical protein